MSQFQIRFRCGLACAGGLFVLCVLVALHTYNYFEQTDHGERDTYLTVLWLGLLQIAASFTACMSSLSIPRRPHVEYDGRPVDQKHTVSAINEWSLSWAIHTLSLARSKTRLELETLPILHRSVRSKYLLSHTKLGTGCHPLWKAMFRGYWRPLLYQSIYGIIQPLIQLAPLVILFAILRILERETMESPPSPSLLALILALGASSIFAAWMEMWTSWLGYSYLALPIRSELSALIYAKTTRLKDLKDSEEGAREQDDEQQNGDPKGGQATSDLNRAQGDIDSAKTVQNIVNHVVSDLELKRTAPSNQVS